MNSNYLLVAVVSPLLPVVVGLITKSKAAPQIKAVLNMGLSFVIGLVNQLVEGSAVWSKELVIATVVAYVISVASYFGVYRTFDTNNKLLPQVGIGSAKN
mgnify:FL=1